MFDIRARTSTIMEASYDDKWNVVRKGKFFELQFNLHWVSFALVFTY